MLSEFERRATIDLAEQFAEKEIAPRGPEDDIAERVPVELVKKLGKIGLLGGVVPEEYGGAGLDYRTYCDVILTLSKADQNLAAFATFPSGLVGTGIWQYGTEEQKQRWLKPLCEGKLIGSAGVTEPRSGSDVAGCDTRYERDGDGFIINGAKAFITNAGVGSFVTVFATKDKALGRAGISAFIVPTDTEGVTFNAYANKLGFRTFQTGDVLLQNVRVPEDALLGEEGQGFSIAMSAVERGRLGVALRAVGLTMSCLELSKQYAKDRIVFGHPIADFQLVQSKITDMAVGAETSKLMVYELGEQLQAGKRARELACMTKMYATDVCQRSANDAVQLHGANGTAAEYMVSRHYRDAKVLQIVEGSNDLHRAVIAEIELGMRSNGERSGAGTSSERTQQPVAAV